MWNTGCSSALGYTAQSIFDLRLHHLSKWRIQECLGEIPDVLGDVLPKEKHGQVLGEVVAVVQEEVV